MFKWHWSLKAFVQVKITFNHKKNSQIPRIALSADRSRYWQQYIYTKYWSVRGRSWIGQLFYQKFSFFPHSLESFNSREEGVNILVNLVRSCCVLSRSIWWLCSNQLVMSVRTALERLQSGDKQQLHVTPWKRRWGLSVSKRSHST